MSERESAMKTKAAKLKFAILFIIAIIALGILASTGSAAPLNTVATPTRPPRDTPAPALFPAPTNTPPSSAATIVPTAPPPTSTLTPPTMTITCLPGWVCDVIVAPNGSESFLVLSVDAKHLGWWESINIPGQWGVRLWFKPSPCVGNISTVRLIDAGVGGVELARQKLGEFCTFVPVVSKE